MLTRDEIKDLLTKAEKRRRTIKGELWDGGFTPFYSFEDERYPFHDSVERNIEVRRRLENVASTIIELNRQQIEQGINSKGESIVPHYMDSTKKIYKKIGKPVNIVNLKYNGDFLDHLYVDFGEERSQGFIISGTDSKTPHLVEKYGEDIFGLTPKNHRLIKDMIWENAPVTVKYKTKNDEFQELKEPQTKAEFDSQMKNLMVDALNLIEDALLFKKYKHIFKSVEKIEKKKPGVWINIFRGYGQP